MSMPECFHYARETLSAPPPPGSPCPSPHDQLELLITLVKREGEENFGECFGFPGTQKVGTKPSRKLAGFLLLSVHFSRSTGSGLKLTGKVARYLWISHVKKFGKAKSFVKGTGAVVEDPDRRFSVGEQITPIYHMDSSAAEARKVPANGEDEFASEDEADNNRQE
ncbi:hypothetical protein BDK51DRAFT_41498 [Blyttiomyces helicus]|uniref:Uncharacterized protein n=1 Tax=Blyttiomyces helicus TaxID=388810 RepID=A0A4P9W455_9FUNG|nr:hypothetical protein BDK51DRAFT_41498 [Blyttiomyces helicus]|eukprot:RKO86053.1 hypothetical protein BDK51DRAFT_41498 [Blyttiomyces helicus]